MEREIYLMRVPKDRILDYNSYEYFINSSGNEPQWSDHQCDANPLQGIMTTDQVSAMYHPGIHRYIILNHLYVYDSPTPWRLWCYAGNWVRYGWYGYQPGIISKDIDDNFFWFTITGQQSPDESGVSYPLNVGQIMMKFK